MKSLREWIQEQIEKKRAWSPYEEDMHFENGRESGMREVLKEIKAREHAKTHKST